MPDGGPNKVPLTFYPKTTISYEPPQMLAIEWLDKSTEMNYACDFSSTLTDTLRDFPSVRNAKSVVLLKGRTRPDISPPTPCTFITRCTLRNHLADRTEQKQGEAIFFCVLQGQLLKIGRFMSHVPECD